ncbi:PDZ domain-containing protein [candidate division KSB1 bacterium]|nr:PDZ domain-containing protein [candidate division KSB1 bacterium]
MLKRMLTHRLIGAAAFFVIFGALLFVALRDGKAVEKTQKSWLGVSVQELTPSLRDAMKVGNRPGLLITNVVRNSPADDAGLRDEDVLLSFDGKTVEKADDFVRLVRNTPPDKKVKIKILRDGEEREIEVTLEARKTASSPRAFAYSWGGDGGNIMAFGRPRLGVQVQELNKDLAPYFKVEEKGGVLVLDVTKDSPAEKAGLKAGDVITKIDGEKITDADDLINALREYEEGDEATVEYVRQGKTATVQAALESSGDHGFHIWGPDHQKIRIRNFGSDNWRDADLIIPELQQHLDRAERRIRENNERLQQKLQRLPQKLDLKSLQTI